MEDFLKLVAARQSDRAYDMSRPVEPEKLERILEAARLAPSACNAQPWKFVVINDPELSVKVGKATAGLGMNKFAKDAPVHILVVEESMNVTSFLGAKIKDKYFPLIDIGIATAHITLAAESEGLGSCILGWFDEKEIKKLTEETQAEDDELTKYAEELMMKHYLYCRELVKNEIPEPLKNDANQIGQACGDLFSLREAVLDEALREGLLALPEDEGRRDVLGARLEM